MSRWTSRRAGRALAASWLLAQVACGGGEPCGGEPSAAEMASLDTDGDGISDADEGRPTSLDTDGDGIADYRDLDSDGDGITDQLEVGDANLASSALDSDGDGTPDFRDSDTDGDSILDTVELGLTFELVDTDGDGVFDILDRDSDGDGISDRDERAWPEQPGELPADPLGVLDADGDEIPDFRDLDSDGDGRPDACEAGDDDLSTPALDTDLDGAPDYRDLDSDGDGVADAEEDTNHDCQVDAGESSPVATDSDGDGFGDLVEAIAGTDASDATARIPDGDFYFVLPYRGAHGSGRLDFATDIRQADVFFSIDNTGSMEGETANIQANLVSSIIPQTAAVIPSVAFGLGRFRDFPLEPHGLTSDLPYQLHQVVTASSSEIGAAINALPTPGGGLDFPESGYEALFQWATGAGLPSFGLPAFQSNAPLGIGGAGFRPGSLPILIHITDAISHVPADYAEIAGGVHGRDQTVNALQGIGARLIGINSLENSGTALEPREQLEDLAVATRATIPPDSGGGCATGVDGASHAPISVGGAPRCPLVFDVQTDGSGLSTLIVDAIQQLVTLADLDVSTRSIGKLQGELAEVLPDGTTTANFIQSIVPVPPPPSGASIEGNVFKTVHPGSSVTFELDAYNDFVPATDKDQLFTIRIQVLGDAVTVLDTRTVFVIVPRVLNLPTVIR